jgi:predicted dehydrogenase
MDKVRIGIIGVGQIGKNHLETYTNKLADKVELVALADVDVAEGKRVSELHKIPNVYTNFRELLKRDDLDAVDVCLHNNFHSPVTVAVLEAGKNCYCEKPMAGAYVDAQAMLDAARRTGKKLSIQLSTLYSTDTKAAKELIDAGRLGHVYHARATGFRRRGRPFVDGYGSQPFVQKANSGGGALYDMGVYHIANMLFLLGNPKVVRVTGRVYQEMDMDPARKAKSGYNVEELGLGFVSFEKNVTLDIIEAWAINLGGFQGPCIVGSQGGIQLSPLSFHSSIGDLDLNSAIDIEEANNRWHRLRENADAYDGPQHHWVAALQGRVPLLPTAEIALNTMLISEGIYRATELGREVTADEIIQTGKSTAIKL